MYEAILIAIHGNGKSKGYFTNRVRMYCVHEEFEGEESSWSFLFVMISLSLFSMDCDARESPVSHL